MKMGGSRSGVSSASRRSAKRKKPKAKPIRLDRARPPQDASLEDWQRGLRVQFGRDEKFGLVNLGEEPIFSEFRVTNPKSGRAYRVVIRGREPGRNFCGCRDFATNALGTCKHIEFTLGKLDRRRGGKAALNEGYTPPFGEVYLEYGPRRAVKFSPGDGCPRELVELSRGFFGDDGALLPDAGSRFDEFLRDAGEVDHELRCYDDALEFIAGLRDDATRRARIAETFRAGIRSRRFQDLLKVPLYDYQREGALFLANAGRAVLGDEMGLGKTIQALAAAEILAEASGVERVLVICPTSLKHQWQLEIAKFTQRESVVIGGPQPERAAGYRTEAFVHITNYDTVKSDLDLIEELQPDLVILDEAQRIKNWETQLARAVKQIRSRYAIVLTGTPIENRLEELVSIVQFVDQHRLGPTYRFLHEHQIREPETSRVIGYRNLDDIGRTLEPVLLRRQKSEVLTQLPERIDNNVFVPMTPQQRELHSENGDQVARIVNRWRRCGFLSDVDQRRLMVCLQNMRMSCNSTYLLDHETDFSHKPDELLTLLEELFERPDAKVVVFSQWVRTHELIIRRLAERKFGHVLFHGGVPSKKRKDLVERFRGDESCRLFLSTDAGGVGLNLQHASFVVNMDLPWNPAVLGQRIGRVHRLGQKEVVRVVNFVAEGTIEDAMRDTLSFKQSLFDGALDGGAGEVFLGKSRMAQFMDTVQSVTERIPQGSVEADAQIAPQPTPGDSPVTTNARGGLRDAAIDGRTTSTPTTGSNGTADAWQTLLTVGAAFFQSLAGANGSDDKPSQRLAKVARLPVERDPASGRDFLKIPVPDEDSLDQLIRAAAVLLERLK
jgi:superfamily II DNA or RNA helicase